MKEKKNVWNKKLFHVLICFFFVDPEFGCCDDKLPNYIDKKEYVLYKVMLDIKFYAIYFIYSLKIFLILISKSIQFFKYVEIRTRFEGNIIHKNALKMLEFKYNRNAM